MTDKNLENLSEVELKFLRAAKKEKSYTICLIAWASSAVLGSLLLRWIGPMRFDSGLLIIQNIGISIATLFLGISLVAPPLYILCRMIWQYSWIFGILLGIPTAALAFVLEIGLLEFGYRKMTAGIAAIPEIGPVLVRGMDSMDVTVAGFIICIFLAIVLPLFWGLKLIHYHRAKRRLEAPARDATAIREAEEFMERSRKEEEKQKRRAEKAAQRKWEAEQRREWENERQRRWEEEKRRRENAEQDQHGGTQLPPGSASGQLFDFFDGCATLEELTLRYQSLQEAYRSDGDAQNDKYSKEIKRQYEARVAEWKRRGQ